MIVGAAFAVIAARLDGGVIAGKSLPETVAAAVVNAFGAPAIWDRNPFWLNGPIWSLFYEIAVNVLYGMIAFALTTRRLAILIIASILAMFVISWHTNGLVFGGHRSTMPMGVVRVVASFFLGVALHRLHIAGLLANGGRRWWIAPILVATFIILPKGSSWSFLYDPIVVFVLYPVLVLAAAGSTAIMPKIAVWSGTVSFPLYVTHEPILKLSESALLPAGDEGPMVIKLVSVCSAVLIAWLALRFYDVPVRTMLRARLGSKRHSGTPAQAV